MADYGVLDEGFVPQTVAEARAEMEEETRQKFGRSFPLGDYTFAGHTIGMLAERLGLLWEVAEATYSAFDVDKNVGASQRALGLLTGTFELPPSSSVVTETLTGDDASVIPADSVVSTSSFGKRFKTTESATLVQLDDWNDATPYLVGDRVTNSTRCYQCITAGISGAGPGPATTSPDITDGTVHWTYLGDGEAAADVICASEDTGPVVAVARDLTVIENPTGGWTSAINLLDAVEGRGKQSDEDFRLLREAELAQPGTGPADAVRAALLAVSGVTNATVFFNVEEATDADGLTPHSCEALVQGGDDQDIIDCLWDNVPLGIKTLGSTVGTAIDDEGTNQTVRFSRPTQKDVYVKVTLKKNPRVYLGDAATKLSIVQNGNGDDRGTGWDVVASAINKWAFIDGVIDVSEVLISVAPTTVPVASTTIPISLRELAVYDTSRITIVSTDGTP